MYDASTDTGALAGTDYTGCNSRNKAIIFMGDFTHNKKYRIGP